MRRPHSDIQSVFVWSEISASGELGLPPPLAAELIHRDIVRKDRS
jgi:hypothetical protein